MFVFYRLDRGECWSLAVFCIVLPMIWKFWESYFLTSGSSPRVRVKGQKKVKFRNFLFRSGCYFWTSIWKLRSENPEKVVLTLGFGLFWPEFAKKWIKSDTFSSYWDFDFIFEKDFLWKCREFFSLSEFVSNVILKSFWSEISQK